MLTYFPRPYPEELLYSILARCRVHLGLNNHKRFVELLYDDRKVAAVVDFPSHLDRLSKTISINREVKAEELIYRHTLFPLYAPFIPEQRRQQVLHAMRGTCGGTLHTRVGVSAGIVKPPPRLRICTFCTDAMIQRYGESYWVRLWQVSGVDVKVDPIVQTISH